MDRLAKISMQILFKQYSVWFVIILACVSCVVQSTSIQVPHVVGGLPAHTLQFPYVAQLQLSKNGSIGTERYCGAARLTKEWFITAAECLNQTLYDEVIITYPTLLIKEAPDFANTNFQLTKHQYKLYPQYNPETKEHNIALLKCDSCLPTDFAGLPALPGRNRNEPLLFGDALVSAWSIWETNEKEGAIRTLRTTILHSNVCKLLHLFRLNTDTLICTSGTFDQNVSKVVVVTTVKTHLQWNYGNLTSTHLIVITMALPAEILSGGDVGAPLTLVKDCSSCKDNLVGITTSFRPWSIYSHVMVFTKLDPYLPWIYNQTGITPVDML